jgi:hypothetical protein
VTVSGSPRLEVEVHGTDTIEYIEILRFGKSDGTFLVINTLYPDDADFTWSGSDPAFKEDSIYYLRLRQVRMVRTRVAMAWSSPIWTRKG